MTKDEVRKHLQTEFSRSQSTYSEAKEQARQIDRLLGYKTRQIEDYLYSQNRTYYDSDPKQFWFGLDIQSLQTPYSELVEMIQYIQPKDGTTWLDLGAGYGRLGVVLGFVRSDITFIGYEFVKERVHEGNRVFKKWDIEKSKIEQADLANDDFDIPYADVYFVYDFGSKVDVYRVIEKLRLIAQCRSITVIARGRGVKNWIIQDCPWLSDKDRDFHSEHWSVFKS